MKRTKHKPAISAIYAAALSKKDGLETYNIAVVFLILATKHLEMEIACK